MILGLRTSYPVQCSSNTCLTFIKLHSPLTNLSNFGFHQQHFFDFFILFFENFVILDPNLPEIPSKIEHILRCTDYTEVRTLLCYYGLQCHCIVVITRANVPYVHNMVFVGIRTWVVYDEVAVKRN